MLDALQETVRPFGYQGTALAHVQLVIDQTPRIPYFVAALQSLVLQYVHIIPRCRIQHLLLLNFIYLLIFHPSNLSRSL